MSKRQWRSGPPPSVGWWPASLWGNEHCLRWWDGSVWSCTAYRGYSRYKVASMARGKMHPTTSAAITWLPRPKSWPDRSRT